MDGESRTGFVRVDGRGLCRAARLTPWYHEDEVCWIAKCELCEVPMAVWRHHGTAPPDEHVAHMQERLGEVATTELGQFTSTATCGTSPATGTPTPSKGGLLRPRPVTAAPAVRSMALDNVPGERYKNATILPLSMGCETLPAWFSRY